ncbi:peptide/nickel transport system permease protein [Caldalkalibacillus uzonensis]|uniref:Peptide/nickel transport system permease protein n=1 Tax=Caldalkalibacillus uzonensis TaxID=353224 RepID=A0ABU0CXV8_9BACI|nr:ABC transporter permease [Caldalkalibacillus uzonensis]MDQ0340986.1 peptide/nickel transport system permease protein [Caldalkalibacillus uzonensis]
MDAKIAVDTGKVVYTKSKLKKERFQLFIRRFLSNRLAVTGTIIIILMCLFSIIAPLLTPYSPLEIDPVNRLQPPSAEHWFGTDNFGRDLFSRVVYGGQVSLTVGLSAALLTSIIGMIVGLYAAYYRLLDHILMRICDGLMAFPDILLAIAITAVLGPHPVNVVIAITIVKIPAMARVVRSAALVVKEQTYIEALRAQGASSWRIIWSHIAPNTVSPFLVQMTYVFALSIILEAGLSFLGAGVPAPNPSWGNILYDGKIVIFSAWWMTVFPGIFITLAVLGLNLFGDGLRDLLDPHTNKANK